MTKSKLIREYLDELFPNPKCELNYNNDYELLIAICLSAQTTDKRVNEVTKVLFEKYPRLEDIKNADVKDLEQIIRPLGSFHKKSCYVKELSTIIVDKYSSIVPTARTDLESLPGVGRKTVNVFLGEFYNYPAIAVDTHVERVSKRLRIAKKDSNVKEVEEKLMKFYPKKEWAKRHLQMVLFGRYYCKAIKPSCENCKLKEYCKEKRK
ncbi:MAG: endonuclease III [bacterium]|nr:endonuclease III [bacterium]